MTGSASRRRSLLVGLVLLVAASAGTASILEAVQSRTRLASWTDNQAELTEAVVQEVINGVINDLEAVAAFVEGSHPDSSSFERFVDSIEGTADAVGVAYLAIIPAAELDAHIEQGIAERGDFYEISQLTPQGGLEPVDRAGRSFFYPTQLVTLGASIRPVIKPDIPKDELGIGVDAGYDPQWRGHIAKAVAANGPAISEFIEVSVSIVVLDRAFFVSVPVRSRDGSVRGLVAAPILEELLLRDLDSRVLDDVQWEVIPHGATPTRVDTDKATVYPLDLPGTAWALAIAPTAAALAALQPQPWWAMGVAAGALASLASLAFWLFVDRRSEHKRVARFRQVADDKDRFLASVSHELRTPLTVVSGVANELHDHPGGFSAQEQSSLMEMLVEQTDELTAIVEDLLIAARNDIGNVVIHYRETDLLAETKRAIDTSGAVATMHGDNGHAWADDQRVRQILRNLLSNARQYGGPTIRAEFSQGPGWVEIVVADNGSGIPPEMQRSVFESYQSAHQPDRGVRSVGIGLYISRNLAEAMDGKLDYSYDGGWSRFRLGLRAAPTDPAAGSPSPAPGAYVAP